MDGVVTCKNLGCVSLLGPTQAAAAFLVTVAEDRAFDPDVIHAGYSMSDRLRMYFSARDPLTGHDQARAVYLYEKLTGRHFKQLPPRSHRR